MFRDKVNQVNSILASLGKSIIQERRIGGQMVLYGYKPQYLFDAVNEVFGAQNWRYELYDTEIIWFSDNEDSGQVIARVEVFMRENEDQEFFSHGVQYGQSNIVHKNIGDATKGAITDAIGKGFSLFSIGSQAYRGELESVYNGAEPEKPDNNISYNNRQPASQHGESEPAIDGELPELPNVVYEYDKSGLVLARGETYPNRFLLKRLGFRWMQEHKAWGLERAA